MARKKKDQKSPQTRSPEEFSEINDKSPRAGDENIDVLSSVVGLGGGVEPMQKVVYVRLSSVDHGEWVETAERHGESLSELVRRCVGPEVERTLRCLHDGGRQVYAWQETCLLCGVRLRG